MVTIEFTKRILINSNISEFNNNTMQIKVFSGIRDAFDNYPERKILDWNIT
jgi:hypothetical protein